MNRMPVLILACLHVFASAEAVTHKEVAWALDWALPANNCEKPRLVSHSYNVKDSEGDRAVTDVDSYTIKRYERKEKRWQKCVDKYKKNLLKDFERLKGSAQYGLTQDQAKRILEHMAVLQQVYMSTDGLLTEEPDSGGAAAATDE